MIEIKIKNTRVPSVNERTIPVALKTGRVIQVPSPAYRKWHEVMSVLFRDQMRKGEQVPVSGPSAVRIEIATAKDIDNIIKPILDCLQECGAIENDREVIRLSVLKYKAKRGHDSFELFITEAVGGETV